MVLRLRTIATSNLANQYLPTFQFGAQKRYSCRGSGCDTLSGAVPQSDNLVFTCACSTCDRENMQCLTASLQPALLRQPATPDALHDRHPHWHARSNGNVEHGSRNTSCHSHTPSFTAPAHGRSRTQVASRSQRSIVCRAAQAELDADIVEAINEVWLPYTTP